VRASIVLLLVGLSLCGGCLYPAGDSRVFVTSEPPGADVYLDGEKTGKTTPAILDLGALFGSDHEIRVKKRGFEPEQRTVYHYTVWGTSRWRDGVTILEVPPLPIFWTFGDMVTPFEVRWTYVPHNLHVKLFEEGTFLPKPGETEKTDTGTNAEQPR
jgi:hypothetical protein